MQLYNTRSGKLESPALESTVSIYVCGITPYDTTHLGHAFTYAAFDTLIRYLRWRGFTVKYVQNVTDVDDDILRRGAQLGVPYRELGDFYLARFLEDMQRLRIVPPDVQPRATEEIPQMQAMIDVLVKQGSAYRRDGNTYFRIATAPGYGALSRYTQEEMLKLARERGGRLNDPLKEHPLDFVLWQATAPGEPVWDSPWGPGRPGWHIECSSMVLKHLGEQIQIHGGGADLVFPHHESETALSEAFTGRRPFVDLWLHTGMVRLHGQKMSKSLGNMVFVSDLLKDHSGEALRLYLASHHYRGTWEHDDADLLEAEKTVALLTAAAFAPANPGAPSKLGGDQLRSQFVQAMEEDMDTPRAIGVIAHLALQVQKASAEGIDVVDAQALLPELCQMFGISLVNDGTGH